MKSNRARVLVHALAIPLAVFAAADALAGGTPLTTTRVAFFTAPLPADDPLYVTHVPGDFDRLFIVTQQGRIWILRDGVILTTAFLDVDAISSCCGEQGLLGLAFDPDYANSGRFYIDYTNLAGDTVIARYEVSSTNPDQADTSTAEILLTIDQPQSNHNGGWTAFSPMDGYLYVGMGDGGNFNDTGSGHTTGTGNGQDITSNLLGKMLRLDVSTETGYAIPPTNPFVGIDGDDEIWAYGLRNPWRNTFDRLTGDLFIADVGQDAEEEVNFQPADSLGGVNYGWRCMEGDNCTGLSGCICNDASLTLPFQTYGHAGGNCSVTGGPIYRGCAIPDLEATYFYADYCSGDIWSLRYDGTTITDFEERTA